jgi:hypothetical protein
MAVASVTNRVVTVAVTVLLITATAAVVTGQSAGGATNDARTVAGVQETTAVAQNETGVVLRNLTAPSEVQVGTEYTVSVDMVNRNDTEAVRRVTYRIAGNVIQSALVRVPSGETETLTFNVTSANTSGFPAGTFTHGAFTDDANVTANLTLVGADETTAAPTNETTAAETTTEAAADATTTEEPVETTTEETTTEQTTTEETTAEQTTEETTTAAPADETATEAPADAASVAFENQSSNGTAVVIDSVAVPEGGFVVVHDTGLIEGEVVESVRGSSEYLDAGTHQNVTVDLDAPLAESQRLVGVVYQDTNDNEAFDFVTSNRTADGPYTRDDGVAINDRANVTVESDGG